jgi:hypothetical protein
VATVVDWLLTKANFTNKLCAPENNPSGIANGSAPDIPVLRNAIPQIDQRRSEQQRACGGKAK